MGPLKQYQSESIRMPLFNIQEDNSPFNRGVIGIPGAHKKPMKNNRLNEMREKLKSNLSFM